MIEKRKTNLKEEIENSEKKARRTVAQATEEAEEEEAENIPQDAEGNQSVEQQMDIDFDAVDKENGYHEEGMIFSGLCVWNKYGPSLFIRELDNN